MSLRSEVMAPTEDREEDVPVLVQPQSAGRHGRFPELVRLLSFPLEAKFVGEQIYSQLRQPQVPVEWLGENSASRSYHPEDKSMLWKFHNCLY